jgi:HK97 family phage major capsid protein
MSTPTAQPIPESLARQLKQGRAERGLLFERAAIDEAARTVSLAIASEIEVDRGTYIEVLECSARAVRLGRLRGGANLLCDHNHRDVVGGIKKESVVIGADRVVRAVARFGRGVRAEEVFSDVLDEIRQNVSVGYLVHEAVLAGQRDGKDIYRVTDWEPYEVSLVSVPADPSVGIGRSLEVAGATEEPQPVQAKETPSEPAPIEPTPKEEKAMSEVKIETPVQRNHAVEIAQIAAASSFAQARELSLASIQAGHTVEQFQGELIRAVSNKPLATADIGLTQKEAKRWSILKVARALANPEEAKHAVFERECSEAVGKLMGRSATGFFMPAEVQKRDLVVGTPTAGGNLVATDLLMGSFIERLRHAMVLDRLGVQFLSGLVGNVAIPKETGDAIIYWVAENTAPTESQTSVGQVTLSPKTAGGFTDIGRTLMNQTSLDVENFVMNGLAKNLGLGIQLAAIAGTGLSNQPSGLLTRITPSVIGGTNGAAPTWKHMIDLESAVSVANADVGTMSYLTNAKVRGKLKDTQKFANTNGMPVWADGNTPINGYGAAITNAVPSNLTKGTAASVASAIIFGNFADLMIGMWGTTDLIRDPYANSTTGGVRIVALQDVDVQVRNTESFATMVDALTV